MWSFIPSSKDIAEALLLIFASQLAEPSNAQFTTDRHLATSDCCQNISPQPASVRNIMLLSSAQRDAISIVYIELRVLRQLLPLCLKRSYGYLHTEALHLHIASDRQLILKPDRNHLHATSDRPLILKPYRDHLHAASYRPFILKPDRDHVYAASERTFILKPSRDHLHAASYRPLILKPYRPFPEAR
jgi:hypothetical protein